MSIMASSSSASSPPPFFSVTNLSPPDFSDPDAPPAGDEAGSQPPRRPWSGLTFNLERGDILLVRGESGCGYVVPFVVHSLSLTGFLRRLTDPSSFSADDNNPRSLDHSCHSNLIHLARSNRVRISKTTLLKCLSDLIPYDEGTCRINGQ